MTIRVKLSETGEIALPQSLRDAHDWAAGTEFDVIEQGEAFMLRPVDENRPRATREQIDAFLAARIKVDRPIPSPEEIKRILLEEAAERFDATRD